MALCKPRLLLSRKSAAADGSGTAAHDAELRLVDGWWHVRRFESGRPVAVNGTECENARLNPNDVLSVGGKFYRITYEPPEQVAPKATEQEARKPKPEGAKSSPVLPTVPTTASSAAPTSVPAAPATAANETPAVPRESGTPRPSTPSTSLGTLIPCGGGPSVVLPKPKIIIGRSRSCDVVIRTHNVSSQHCSLELINGYWQMVDLDSKNGTSVDGMKYLRKWILPGSVLGLPGTRYRLEYQSTGDPPPMSDDDEIVLPNRSLLKMAGVGRSGLDELLDSLPEDEPVRPRWKLEE
jgi:adenylate cyclase